MPSTRKVDCLVANAVTGLATSAQKFAGDLRHLANLQEIAEPREKMQIGSSAMVRAKSCNFCIV
jgi:adenylosuccinate lyase